MDPIVNRAFTAWFRSGGTDQPAGESGIETHKGKDYDVDMAR
jgi:hypothetical protein